MGIAINQTINVLVAAIKIALPLLAELAICCARDGHHSACSHGTISLQIEQFDGARCFKQGKLAAFCFDQPGIAKTLHKAARQREAAIENAAAACLLISPISSWLMMVKAVQWPRPPKAASSISVGPGS